MSAFRKFSNSRSRPEPQKPAEGQESVWDYPRPPRVEPSAAHVVVRFGGQVIVDTTDAVRVLETSHPPVFYVPMSDVAPGCLVPVDGSTFCEFKGQARYFNVVAGGHVARRAAWAYPRPSSGFEVLADKVAIYPSHMDSCEVDGERVTPQEGDFYGGWITSNIVGPFKGAPGTMGW